MVEGLEELVLLLFEVLVLLEADFELPLDVLEFTIMLHYCCLSPSQRVHYAIVHMTLPGENFHLLRSLLERLNYLFVGLFLV